MSMLPKNVGKKVLQRCVKQLINKYVMLFFFGFCDVCDICQCFLFVTCDFFSHSK